MGAVAALGFGISFHASLRARVGIALAGAVTLVVQALGVKGGLAVEAATFLAGRALGVLAQECSAGPAMPTGFHDHGLHSARAGHIRLYGSGKLCHPRY